MEDGIFTAIRWFMLLAGLVLVVFSIWSLWCNPAYWALGAVCGGLLVAASWTMLGLIVMGWSSDGAPERAEPAWPLFLNVLALVTTTGVFAGGLSGAMLWGEAAEARKQAAGRGRRRKSSKRSDQAGS